MSMFRTCEWDLPLSPYCGSLTLLGASFVNEENARTLVGSMKGGVMAPMSRAPFICVLRKEAVLRAYVHLCTCGWC